MALYINSFSSSIKPIGILFYYCYYRNTPMILNYKVLPKNVKLLSNVFLFAIYGKILKNREQFPNLALLEKIGNSATCHVSKISNFPIDSSDSC